MENHCTSEELENTLSQHTGSENLTRIRYTDIHVTDGILDMAEKAHAHWLVTDIATVCSRSVGCGVEALKDKPFLLIELVVNENGSAYWTVKEDCNMPVLYRQNYTITDFPVGTWKFYVEGGVFMLPSER